MHSRAFRIWDLPVRLFHWSLVILIATAYWTAEEGGLMLTYHMWCGYSILTLVLFRIGWGLVGSESARFSSFLAAPRRVFASLGDLANRQPLHFRSHNPLGGWMVVALLAVLLVQTSSGLFANDDLFNEGPLYSHVSKAVSDRLTALHHFNFGLIATLVGVHVAAIVYHRVRKGERLTGSMITGVKQLPASTTEPRFVSSWRALALLGASAAIVALIVNL